MPSIPKQEFAERVRRVQARLAEQNLDAVLVYGRSEEHTSELQSLS
jgi:hypothetical protein